MSKIEFNNHHIRDVRSALNIWWKDYKRECLTHNEFVTLCKSLDKSKAAKTKSQYRDWDIGNWYLERKGLSKFSLIELHIWDKEKGPITYFTNPQDDTRNNTIMDLDDNPGSIAYKAVVQKFSEQYNGVTLKKAFDTTEADYKFCVPKQFYWLNEKFKDKIILSASAVDYCSQYPSNLCGLMPDGHKRLEIKGRILPNKDYPFAFYLKTGTVAEFDIDNNKIKYDTHNWINSKFSNSLFTEEQLNAIINTSDSEEITILMKASKYKFDDIMKYFYSERKTNPIAKLVMNAFIGMLHTRSYTSHKYTHIAAISIARSNERMRELAENMACPLHICVDGCIYLGPEEYGNHIKALLELNQEFTDCKFKYTQMNCYVAIDKETNQVVKFKHGAFNARTDNGDIETCEGFDYLSKLCKINNIENILNELEIRGN